MIRTITAIVVTSTLLSSFGYAKWGAKDIGEKYRPKTSWMEHFSDTPDIIADNSVNEAIERCDEVVGEGNYCTVGIRGGILHEHVEIFRSKTKLIAVDDTPIKASEPGTMFFIGDNTRYVVIEGLKIEGIDAGDEGLFGIVVEGKNIRYITICRNEIYNFFVDNGDAHAIAVYGTGGTAKNAVKHVTVSDNTVHDMRTGSSESIALNGNVYRWQIVRNDIYDINNIAIDVIGGEGTAPTRKTKNGRILPGKYDAARYGYIEDNFVENLHTTDNPAYDNTESWAAAIYIDGGHHIRIRDNVVVDSAWGYEIGAENCIVTRHITMYGNSAENDGFGDLVLGGYNTVGYRANKNIQCNPHATSDNEEGHGYVRYLTIYDNDFASTETEEKNILLQYRTTHAIIEQEGVEPVNADGDGSAKGDDNAVRTKR
jgi:hypothetical protein